MADLEPFLVPVAGSDPSGIELRNDGRFHAIERLLEPTSRSARAAQVEQGGSGSVQLDWQDIIRQSVGLAAAGRDLRLLVIVARALANAEGFDGLAAGLGLLTETIRRHWDSMHPVLRDSPSRREAATRRINALYQLENTDNGLLCDLEYTPVLSLRLLGPVTGADLAVGMLSTQVVLTSAPGLAEKEKGAVVAAHDARIKRVRAATRAQASEQPEAMATLVSAIAGSRGALSALEATIDERVAENGVGVRFEKLGTFLARIAQTLAAAQAAVAPGAAPAGGVSAMPDDPASAMNGTTQPAAAADAAGGAVPGRVNSRREVELCLDRIIDFYERTEPSSPIPHLARRMRKMVSMNFLQLMEEIAPSGMKEFRNIAGVIDEKPN